MKDIYLVMEFDNRHIYLPFKSLEAVDEYTIGFDNPLELVATTKDIIGLDIPNEEILDAYLASDISNIEDDMQEFKERYLSIKYRRDNYDKYDLEKQFISYINYNLKNNVFKEFSGLENVYNNYLNRYVKDRELKEKDVMRIALLYLGSNYKRYKECYYILKDKKYKIKIKEKKTIYSESNIKQMLEDDKMLLINGTNMNIPELYDCVSRQNKGKSK